MSQNNDNDESPAAAAGPEGEPNHGAANNNGGGGGGRLDKSKDKDYDDDDHQRTEFLYPFTKIKDKDGKVKWVGPPLPWHDVIIPDYVKPFIKLKTSQGSKPTLRGVLYYLESKRVIPKNDITYDRLKDVMSIARRGRKKRDGTRGPPSIPMDAFADNTRQIIKDFSDEERSLTDYIDDGISHFRYLPEGFTTLIPRWLDQTNYIEVWVEKDAKARDVQKALHGRHVVIAPNRGNVGITFIHNNIERLIDQFIQKNRERVYILYLGDLDPRGWDMDSQIKRDLARQTKGLTDDDGNPIGPRFVFKRIGITVEQIKKYKLTHLMKPDEMTLEKLKKADKLADRFKRQFGSLFQIELEAFDLIPFAEFQKLIRREVDKYFNKQIYNKVLKRPEYSQKPDVIREQIVDRLYSLISEFEEENEKNNK